MPSARTLALCLALVALAGCTGTPAPGATPTSATPTETPPRTVAEESPAPSPDGEETSPSATDGGETTAYGTAYTPPDRRVQITSRAATAVTVSVVGPENGTTFERTHEPNAGDLDLEGAFSLEGPHRVLVEAGGEVRWNRTVYEYEMYELLVTENGSVRVESYSQV